MGLLTDILKEIPQAAVLKEKITSIEAKYAAADTESAILKDDLREARATKLKPRQVDINFMSALLLARRKKGRVMRWSRCELGHFRSMVRLTLAVLILTHACPPKEPRRVLAPVEPTLGALLLPGAPPKFARSVTGGGNNSFEALPASSVILRMTNPLPEGPQSI